MLSKSKLQKAFRASPLIPFYIVHGIMMSAVVSSSLFVTAFIYKANNSLLDIASYYICFHSGALLCSIAMGNASRNCSVLTYLRASMLVNALFFLTLYQLQDYLPSIIMPVGLLAGVGAGLYWLPFNVFVAQCGRDGCNQGTRFVEFFSTVTILGSVVTIAVPALVGLSIWCGGAYSTFFLCMLCMFSVACVVSAYLPNDLRISKPNYDVSSMLATLRNDEALWRMSKSFFWSGFSYIGGALTTLGPLVVFRTSSSELLLGMVASCLPLIEMCSSYYARGVKRECYAGILIGSALALLVLTCITLLSLTVLNSIVYAVIYSACVPMLSILFNFYSFKAIETRDALKNNLIEYLVVREMFLALGRISAFCLLFFVASLFTAENSTALQTLLVLLVATMLPMALLLGRVNLKPQ